MEIRLLERGELDLLWSIDRAEEIDHMFVYANGDLLLRPERHDVTGWPPEELERNREILADCFAHGGFFEGAFEGDRLVGAAVLEQRFIGEHRDTLQLKFLHVSRAQRGRGLGATLFSQAAERARSLGARSLYISATPSEATVRFYRARGCELAETVDPALFALEPEDIHFTLDLGRAP